ncbi:MAG: hypothetical protein OXG37_06490 [Actinomycetia bacterium]|nr:hypothetical protein [Actinomycetes bacterium]
MRRAVTLALLGGIVALVVVIATSLLGVDRESAGVESGEEAAGGPSVLRGPDVPPAGVLPGRLWVVSLSRGVSRVGGEACWIRSVSLDELSLEPTGKLQHCTLADVSLDGRFGTAFDDDLNLVLLDLRGRPRPARTLGRAFWDPSPRTLRVAALAADGSRVAWCSTPNETVVQSVEGGAEQRFLGCDPRFLPTGQVVTRTIPPLPDAVLTEGEPLLDSTHFREGLGLSPDEAVALMAYDVADDGSVATKVRRVVGQPQPIVQIWDGSTLIGRHPVSGLASSLGPSGIELSPDAARVALGWPGLLAEIFDFELGRMNVSLDQGPYAWSPDGRWLAVGTLSSVAIYAPGSQAPTYVLPLSPLMLSWSR